MEQYIPTTATNKSILGEKKVGHITFPNFNLHYKVVITKIAWYWNEDRHSDQWNGLEYPEVDPHAHDQLTFDKEAKSMKWSNKASSASDAGKTGQVM